jgi:hypothetical protein
VDDNEEPHSNSAYLEYEAWYKGVTRPRLRLQWTHGDCANIESPKDEDMTYDWTTRVGRQVEAGPVLDRVVHHLDFFCTFTNVSINSNSELCCRATPSDSRS